MFHLKINSMHIIRYMCVMRYSLCTIYRPSFVVFIFLINPRDPAEIRVCVSPCSLRIFVGPIIHREP